MLALFLAAEGPVMAYRMLLFEIKEIRALESSQHMNNPSLHKSKENDGR